MVVSLTSDHTGECRSILRVVPPYWQLVQIPDGEPFEGRWELVGRRDERNYPSRLYQSPKTAQKNADKLNALRQAGSAAGTKLA